MVVGFLQHEGFLFDLKMQYPGRKTPGYGMK
jgi:hypothetical protein